MMFGDYGDFIASGAGHVGGSSSRQDDPQNKISMEEANHRLGCIGLLFTAPAMLGLMWACPLTAIIIIPALLLFHRRDSVPVDADEDCQEVKRSDALNFYK